MASKKQGDEIDDEYPDLSDFDSDGQQEEKEDKSKDKNNREVQDAPKIVVPAFLGGGLFMPPPPPQGRPPPKDLKAVVDPNLIKPNNFPSIQRERKNCLYLKNIPKTLNKTEKLSTFFRTYGSIKNIKSNEEERTAVIRFDKEQDALKFINSKVKAFNRSFILYDLKQDFDVPEEMFKECEKDEAANAKTVEHQFIKIRQAAESILADKYRSLLFLSRQELTEQLRQEIDKQLIKCRAIIKSQNNNKEVNEMLINIENQYDWTIILQIPTKTQIEKKKLISQYIKYGPIGQIQIRLAPYPEAQDPEEKLATIKLKYLGVKSSWLMYKENCQNNRIGVQGRKIKDIYHDWQLRLPADKPAQSNDAQVEDQPPASQAQKQEQA